MKLIKVPLIMKTDCAEHGVKGMHLCPWPDCKNGISESQCKVESIVEGREETIFTRREWSSPLGGKYYTWDSSKLPNWFFAPAVLWNEARRNNLIASSYPSLIYQYTTLEGFVGITKNQCLWMSDYSYLNDK